MKFGIIGPRDFNGSIYDNANYVGKVLSKYRERYGFTEVISGGGKGIEALVETWCRDNNVPCTPIMPNIKMHGPQDAFIYRNNRILKECDILMLFYDGYNQSAIRTLSPAMEEQKPVYVIPMV